MKNILNFLKKEDGTWDRGFIRFFIILIFLVIAFTSLFNIDYNKGTSNTPTIKEGQITFAVKHFFTIRKDDFIIFSKDEYFKDERITKRVIATEGDHVEIKNGMLFVNGKKDTLFPNEHYVENINIIVPDDCYFVMGDNRDVSLDSRYFGLVKRSEIIGKVIWY